MKKTTVLSFLLLALLSASAALASSATPPPLTPAPIVSLALYKNGTALVVRRVEPPAGGAPILLDGRLAPAHGTFWTVSPTPLAMTAAPRRVALPPDTLPARPPRAETYAGREATVWTRVPVPLADSVRAAADAPSPATISLAAGTPDSVELLPLRGTVLPPAGAPPPNGLPPSLTLRLPNGSLVRIPKSAISAVSAEGADSAEIPVLEIAGATAPFHILYLARGAAWAPSYRLSFLPSDPAAPAARLEMAAEIRNELEALSAARLYLVSGFPNIESANVAGLLSGGATLSSFLNALSGAPDPRYGRRAWEPAARDKLTQIAWVSNAGVMDESGTSPIPDVVPEAGASDIHYRAVGPLTLANHSTLRLPLGDAELPVERFVDWEPGWKYDEYGRRQEDGLEGERVPWDSIRFKNPLDHPLTTGPAFVCDASAPLADTGTAFSRPLGQTTLRWTNPGQEAVLRVTKALSVATTFAETIPGRLEDYPTVNWDTLGTRFRRIEVEAAITAVNHRADPVTLVIRPTVVGEYQSASLPPDSVQTEGSREARSGNGNRQPNPTQKLRWSLSLPPGESLTLTYRYTTLIRI